MFSLRMRRKKRRKRGSKGAFGYESFVGSVLAGRSAGGGNRNNHFAVNDSPNGGAGRGRAREDIQPERPRKEQGEFLGENPQLGKDDGKNKVTQDTSPAFATSGPSLFEDNKWNFLYGRATGSSKNIERSQQLCDVFSNQLGLPENEVSKKVLLAHFDDVARNYPIIGGLIAPSSGATFPKVKKISQFTGPSGVKAKLIIIYELQESGVLRFVSVIPKVYK